MKKTIPNILYLTKYISRYKPSAFLYIIYGAVIQGVKYSAEILGIRFVVDYIISQKGLTEILNVLFIYLGIVLICNLLITFSSFLARRIFDDLSIRMSTNMMEKAVQIDYSCFDNTEYYDKYTRALSEASGAAQKLVGTYVSIASSFITILSIVSIVVSMTGRFEYLVISAVSVAASLIITSAKNKMSYMHNIKMTRKYRFVGYIKGLFWDRNASREMRIFNSSDYFLKIYLKNQKDVNCDEAHFTLKYCVPGWIDNLIYFIVSFCTIFLVTYQISNGQASIAIFASTISAVTSLSQQMNTFLSNIPAFINQSKYINNLREIADIDISLLHKNESIDLQPSESYKIEFRNVSFIYPNATKYALKNVSFIINKSERACFVGENGAGKTTLTKLLFRLYEPTNGTILINDIDICNYTISSLRDAMSVVFQDCILYATSIGENLFFGEEKTDRIKKALDSVELTSRFESEPDSFNSKISRAFDEKGVLLSGGEAQRVFIARALEKNAGILVLDEPSSSLDPIAEDNLFHSITNAMEHRTVMMISHRLLFCKDMDVIYYIKNGEILEYGNHKSLMDLKGDYYHMFTAQADHYQIQK